MSRYVNAFLSGYRQLNVISNNFETVSCMSLHLVLHIPISIGMNPHSTIHAF